MATIPQRVITRDRSSGRLHKRLRYGGRWYVDERCQTDQSGAFDEIQRIPESEPDENKCKYCFDPEL